MRVLKLAVAFLAGACLYYGAVVFVGGVLAALAIPRSYFEFFGKQNLPVALAIVNLVAWAVPVAFLTAAGYLAGKRLLPAIGRALPYALTLGMLACAAYWLWFAEGGLASLVLVPWWSAANALAPWLGAALGMWLISRSKIVVAHAGA